MDGYNLAALHTWSAEGNAMNRFLAAAVALFLGASSAFAQTFWEPMSFQQAANGLIIFAAKTAVTKPNSNKMLFTLMPGGSPRALTLGMQPAISPDGKFAVFTRQVDSPYHRQLWRINTDGTGLRQLTFLTDDPIRSSSNASSISPDGRTIAFFCGVEESMVNPHLQSTLTYGHRDVCTMPSAGGPRVRLTNCKPVYTQAQLNASTICIVADNPKWTPDGRTIFFETAWKTGRMEIWSINPDGTNLRRLR